MSVVHTPCQHEKHFKFQKATPLLQCKYNIDWISRVGCWISIGSLVNCAVDSLDMVILKVISCTCSTVSRA